MKKSAMNKPKIEKVTLNIGVGEAGQNLEKAQLLLERISGAKIIRTKATKRLPAFNIRPGLEIGVKTTLRGKKAEQVLEKILIAVHNKLYMSNFDEQGNVNFGIDEYIDIPEIKYDPKIGILGLNVCVTMSKPGYRVKLRKIKKAKVGKKQRVTKKESIEYFKKEFGVEVE